MVQLLDGDRVGLVAFAGTAFLQCPLTVDYAAFEASLRATNVGIIPRGGTALERAIDTSLAAFEAGEGKHQAVILITDGEDHEGDPEKAAERAAERGVKVYTVGIGTAEGDLVPAGQVLQDLEAAGLAAGIERHEAAVLHPEDPHPALARSRGARYRSTPSRARNVPR